MKKVIFVLLFCVMAVSLVSAGGAKDTQTSGKMELTFLNPVNVGGPMTALIDKICADFNKENPDIVVNPVYTGNYDDTVNKIQAAIQGKNPPDFFINLATQRFSMAAIPLDDLIAADGPAGKAYIDDFLSGF
ncbi:MAG: extracellular solute-binding protein [Treponema sp.]|jgi:sn-glycerol 3-phosphate transport system substrate-binding protein|nr:extracellular solute-binding protein [Treponema sp.]